MAHISRRTALKGSLGILAPAALRGSQVALAGSSTGDPKIVVIGAGITGLSAAFDLRRAGFDVKVVDKNGEGHDSRVTGGVADTDRIRIFDTNHALPDLLSEIGMDVTPTSPGNTALGIDSDVVPILADTLRACTLTDPCHLDTAAFLDSQSVAQYSQHMLAKETRLLRVLEDRGIQTDLQGRSSVAAALSLLGHLPASSTINVKGGEASINARLAEFVPVNIGTDVLRVRSTADNQEIKLRSQLGFAEQQEIQADLVVVAVSGRDALALLDIPDARHVRLFENVTYGDEGAIFESGSLREISIYLEEQRRHRQRLYFAGKYLSHNHVAAACASGRDVAASVARHWT